MKITKRQLKQIIKEEFDLNPLGMSKYDLYDKPGAAEAEAEFDALMNEVAEFMGGARKRLDALVEKHSDLGTDDDEAYYAIQYEFKKAVGVE